MILLEPVFHLEAGDAVEVPAVAGDESEVPVHRRTRQPDVLQRDVLTSADQRGHDVRRGQRVFSGERQDLKAGEDVAFDPFPQRRGLGGTRGSVAQFKHGDCADRKARSRLAVQTGKDFEIGDSFDQLADDVGVEEEHGELLKVDLPPANGRPAGGSNFVQRGKERVILLKPFAGPVWSIGLGHRRSGRTNHGAQRFFDQRTKRLALPSRLRLGFPQDGFIDVQCRLHSTKLRVQSGYVNAPNSESTNVSMR